MAPYLTSKFSVRAARTLFSNTLLFIFLSLMGYHRKSRDSFQRRSEELFMFRRNIHVEELLIIKIEKIVLLFLEYVKPFFLWKT